MSRIAHSLLDLPRTAKRAIALTVDATLCLFTVWLSFGLRIDKWGALSGIQWMPVVVSLALALPLFIRFGLYRAIFRYGGHAALNAVIRAMIVYGIAYSLIFTFISVTGIPRTVGLIQPVLMLVGVGGVRLIAQQWLSGVYRRRLASNLGTRALIYGAGSAGRQLAAVLAHGADLTAVGFIDDDRTLQGNTINGLKIYGPDRLRELIEDLGITEVLLAIPTASRARRNEIIAALRPFAVRVRTLPNFMDLAHGRVEAGDLRELDIEDLLGRDPVSPNGILLNRNVRNKTVLVTGAGGSIGSELCRQILKSVPTTLLLVEASEYALYAIHDELKSHLEKFSAQTRILPLLGSVQDQSRMIEIMETWRPDTVYHAAAYKHVPLVEHNPVEGVKNNVNGTLVAAQAALEVGVSNFVLVSTDKAVRPTNVMGASKRLAEMTLQALADEHRNDGKTKFSMVRFGNVLGSSGSVVPLFRKQIKEGGPVTVTHPNITRYFMTIPEAAQLVIQASAMAVGGDVFVLDMGEPVRIFDLARRMIELSGLNVRDEASPEGDIEIVMTGLRPGEKLYEELLIGGNPEPTQHPRIMKAHEDFVPWAELQQKMLELNEALDRNDARRVRYLLQQLVPGYQPTGDVVDWICLEISEATAQAS